MPILYSMGSTSSSCTYGNAIKALEQELLRYFPKDYFNYIHVSSQLVFREEAHQAFFTDAELKKREKPLFLLRPSFENNKDIPFTDTMLTSNVYANSNAISVKSVYPLIKDQKNRIIIGFRMNRDAIPFECNIRTQTLVDQLDVYKMMQNNMQWGGPYQRSFALESVIPYELIHYMASMNGLDLTKPEHIPLMMHYLQSHSSYPITYKIRNSTSQPEFFMYYRVPVMITLEDLNIDQGSKKGMVDDTYEISFSIRCEFNLPGVFLMYGNEMTPHKFNIRIRSDVSENSTSYIPIYTMDRLFEDNNMLLNGYKMYTTTIFQTEAENYHLDDTLDLHCVIHPQYIQVIRKYDTSDIPSDILFRVLVFAGQDKLEEGKDFTVDWSLMRLTVHNSDPEITYRIIVYANMDKLNDELVDIQNMESSEKSYSDLFKKKDSVN